MGLPAVGQVAEGHRSRVSRRLRSLGDRKEAGSLRSLQSRPERKDEKNRLSQTSRQGTVIGIIK